MNFKSTLGALVVVAMTAGGAMADNHGLPKIPMLTLEVAKKMAAVCEAMSVEKGWSMDIAIVDRGADLVLFHRMDNAFLISHGSRDQQGEDVRVTAVSDAHGCRTGAWKGWSTGGLPGSRIWMT